MLAGFVSKPDPVSRLYHTILNPSTVTLLHPSLRIHGVLVDSLVNHNPRFFYMFSVALNNPKTVRFDTIENNVRPGSYRTRVHNFINLLYKTWPTCFSNVAFLQ